MEHRVKDLPQDARHVVEQLLGHTVSEEETISIRSTRIIKHAPSQERRREIAKEFKTYFERIDKKFEGLDEHELDAVYEEAMRHVRPSYDPE